MAGEVRRRCAYNDNSEGMRASEGYYYRDLLEKHTGSFEKGTNPYRGD
jgi:hypothetical protein